MKLLLLLRHASAEPGANVGDHDRRLSERGRAEAAAVASRLHEDGVAPQLALASTAVRAVETVEAVAAAGDVGRVVITERLYLAAADDLLDEVRGVDDGVERLLVVGHNPGLQRLALALVEADASGELKTFAPARVAGLRFDVGRWADVGEGAGRLVVSTGG